MIDKLQACVAAGEKLGAQFVEARYDDLTLRTLNRTNDVWKDIILRSRAGIGITCYHDGVSGYSFTASTSKRDLEEAAKRAFKMAKAAAPAASLKLDFDHRPAIKSKASDTFRVKVHPRTKDLEYKTELVNRALEAARETGKEIQSVMTWYGELFGQKLFTNSEGATLDWEFLVVDLYCRVTSKTKDGDLVNGVERASGTKGMELFSRKGSTPEDVGRATGANATEQLKAKACPAGEFRALVENRLAGVLAHESFGHLSEADFVVIGMSPITGKIGERLGTDHATIIDEGTPEIAKYGGLWIPFDDQGTPASKTVVLDKGILKHYLHNRGTAKHLKQKPTGNSRAVHYAFVPIPRMTNTYFKPGDLTEEEALENLGTGVYAIQTAGGQVEGDGSFLFKAIRGYWVEGGQIKHPLREVSLSGNILQFLKKVEGCTKDLMLIGGYFGGCGKEGQYPLPCGLGGPKMVVADVRFGGKA